MSEYSPGFTGSIIRTTTQSTGSSICSGRIRLPPDFQFRRVEVSELLRRSGSGVFRYPVILRPASWATQTGSMRARGTTRCLPAAATTSCTGASETTTSTLVQGTIPSLPAPGTITLTRATGRTRFMEETVKTMWSRYGMHWVTTSTLEQATTLSVPESVTTSLSAGRETTGFSLLGATTY